MRVTEILGEEHRWIRDMLDCMTKVIELSVENGIVDTSASELLSLFETFGDGSHQDTEESVLFPRLLQRASPKEGDLIRRLHEDHGKDRLLMSGMQCNLLGAAHGEPLCLREFVEQARAYVRMHKNHMRRENDTLFPLADRVLTHADDLAMLESMSGQAAMSRPVRERIRARIDALCEHFGVPERPLPEIKEETA